jgi:hypothetical protein
MFAKSFSEGNVQLRALNFSRRVVTNMRQKRLTADLPWELSQAEKTRAEHERRCVRRLLGHLGESTCQVFSVDSSSQAPEPTIVVVTLSLVVDPA